MHIRVQTEDFDAASELARLRDSNAAIGAIVSFIGTVRGATSDESVSSLELEHYPGMTEKTLAAIAESARVRWSLPGITIIHRVGKLMPGEQIVLVAIASPHRAEAFAACEYIMDVLKTEAPFWKNEMTANGSRWVDARESDDAAAARWVNSGDSA